MRTVAPHAHHIEPTEWPFAEPHNAAVFTTSRHLYGGEPILLVSHERGGDWQLLCGDVQENERCIVICLACAYLRDTTIGALADLPAGWEARRDKPTGAWVRYPIADEETGAAH